MGNKIEYCKGYKPYMRERVYVIRKPYITWNYQEDSNIQIGYIDDIPVCAVDKKGFLSGLTFKEDGSFGDMTGCRFFAGGSKFKNKLNAMKSAYLHVPIFFKATSHEDKIKSFYGKYYDIEITKEGKYRGMEITSQSLNSIGLEIEELTSHSLVLNGGKHYGGFNCLPLTYAIAEEDDTFTIGFPEQEYEVYDMWQLISFLESEIGLNIYYQNN